MLTHKRVERGDTSSMDLDASVVRGGVVMHPEVQRAVWHESNAFLNDRNLFDPQYFCFVWNLIHLVTRPPPRPDEALQQRGDVATRALQVTNCPGRVSTRHRMASHGLP